MLFRNPRRACAASVTVVVVCVCLSVRTSTSRTTGGKRRVTHINSPTHQLVVPSTRSSPRVCSSVLFNVALNLLHHMHCTYTYTKYLFCLFVLVIGERSRPLPLACWTKSVYLAVFLSATSSKFSLSLCRQLSRHLVGLWVTGNPTANALLHRVLVYTPLFLLSLSHCILFNLSVPLSLSLSLSPLGLVQYYSTTCVSIISYSRWV